MEVEVHLIYIIYREGRGKQNQKSTPEPLGRWPKGKSKGAEVNEDDEISPTDDTDLTGLSQI